MRDINGDDKRLVEAKCPQCGELTADMGMDFEAPKKDNVKEWEHIKTLYSVGITFHSCGCGGPGYIPKTTEKLVEHFEEILQEFNRNLTFWRQRIEPVNEREINRENSKNWNFIGKIPYEHRSKNPTISNEEAIAYWIGKIKEVELKIGSLRKPSYK